MSGRSSDLLWLAVFGELSCWILFGDRSRFDFFLVLLCRDGFLMDRVLGCIFWGYRAISRLYKSVVDSDSRSRVTELMIAGSLNLSCGLFAAGRGGRYASSIDGFGCCIVLFGLECSFWFLFYGSSLML